MSDPVAVWLNCGECGVGEAVAVPAFRTSGVVKCWSCSAPVDVAHAFAHARWCVVCGEDLSECGCDTPDRLAVSDALISLDRIVAGLSAPVREGSAEAVDPDAFRFALAELLADVHDRIARALSMGDDMLGDARKSGEGE